MAHRDKVFKVPRSRIPKDAGSVLRPRFRGVGELSTMLTRETRNFSRLVLQPISSALIQRMQSQGLRVYQWAGRSWRVSVTGCVYKILWYRDEDLQFIFAFSVAVASVIFQFPPSWEFRLPCKCARALCWHIAGDVIKLTPRAYRNNKPNSTGSDTLDSEPYIA